MALFIRQNDERSKLQERIAAELQERAKQRTLNDATPPDGVNDSKFMEGTKRTTSLAWIWIIVVLLAIVGFVLLLIANTTGR